MPSHSTHPDTTRILRKVRSRANRHNQQKRGPMGNSQLPLTKLSVSILAGECHSSRGGSSIASTLQRRNSAPSSSLNNPCVADITQLVASTVSATEGRSMKTPTAAPGITSHSPPSPGETSQTNSTRHLVSSPSSSIACSPTPLSGLENLPAPIPNPEACTIITNPLQTQATARNQKQRQWKLQPHAVSTPRPVVSGSCNMY